MCCLCTRHVTQFYSVRCNTDLLKWGTNIKAIQIIQWAYCKCLLSPIPTVKSFHALDYLLNTFYEMDLNRTLIDFMQFGKSDTPRPCSWEKMSGIIFHREMILLKQKNWRFTSTSWNINWSSCRQRKQTTFRFGLQAFLCDEMSLMKKDKRNSLDVLWLREKENPLRGFTCTAFIWIRRCSIGRLVWSWCLVMW